MPLPDLNINITLQFNMQRLFLMRADSFTLSNYQRNEFSVRFLHFTPRYKRTPQINLRRP